MRRRPIRRNGNGVSLSGPPIDPPSAWMDSEDRPQDLPKPGPCFTPGCEALTIFYRCESCQAVARG